MVVLLRSPKNRELKASLENTTGRVKSSNLIPTTMPTWWGTGPEQGMHRLKAVIMIHICPALPTAGERRVQFYPMPQWVKTLANNRIPIPGRGVAHLDLIIITCYLNL